MSKLQALLLLSPPVALFIALVRAFLRAPRRHDPDCCMCAGDLALRAQPPAVPVDAASITAVLLSEGPEGTRVGQIHRPEGPPPLLPPDVVIADNWPPGAPEQRTADHMIPPGLAALAKVGMLLVLMISCAPVLTLPRFNVVHSKDHSSATLWLDTPGTLDRDGARDALWALAQKHAPCPAFSVEVTQQTGHVESVTVGEGDKKEKKEQPWTIVAGTLTCIPSGPPPATADVSITYQESAPAAPGGAP